MSATIIDHASKSSVRIVRVIIARYREDCPRSERPLISSGRPGRAWAPWSPKSVRRSVDGMFKYIPFNGSAAFLTKFMRLIKSTSNFSSTDMSLSRNKFICAGIAWTQTWFSISHLCKIKRLPHENHRLDFHTIYKKWPAAYTVYIHQNLSKLNECI